MDTVHIQSYQSSVSKVGANRTKLEQLLKFKTVDSTSIVDLTYWIAAFAEGVGFLPPLTHIQKAHLEGELVVRDDLKKLNADDATLICSIVESGLLPSVEVVAEHGYQLRNTIFGLPLFGGVLRAYVECLQHPSLISSETPSRLTLYLSRAIEGLRKGKASHTFTVAHLPFVRGCHALRHPTPALTLLEEPLYHIGSPSTGVLLAEYIAYCAEGAQLLAELHQYANAACCLYNVLSVVKRQPPCKGVRCSTILRSCDSGLSSDRHHFTPSEAEKEVAQQVYEAACKLSVVLFIIAFGGRPRNGEDKFHYYMKYDTVYKAPMYLGKNYLSLWNAACTRDPAVFSKALHRADFSSLGDYGQTLYDEMQKHFIVDLAYVYNRLHLSDIIDATCFSVLEETTGGKPKDSKRLNPNHAAVVQHRLLELQEENRLLPTITLAEDGNHIVELALPPPDVRQLALSSAGDSVTDVLHQNFLHLQQLQDTFPYLAADIEEWESYSKKNSYM